jgi:hypothetical protein
MGKLLLPYSDWLLSLVTLVTSSTVVAVTTFITIVTFIKKFTEIPYGYCGSLLHRYFD